MRCFFAVEVPDIVKAEVKLLSKKHPSIKFVPSTSMHLTLKFMGEVEDVEVLINSVKLVKQEKFSVQLRGVGCFPNKDFIRVLWLGVGNGRTELNFLADKIDSLTTKFRRNDHAVFIPHLTISRCNGKCDKKILYEEFVSSEFLVDSFVLMKTEFTNEGVKHSVLERFSLI
jgi:2'-5' RNA ligase